VLRTAALLGAEFSAAELGGVTGLAPAESVEVLEEAIAAGVLESAGSLLRFRHGLIKQALYEATPPPVRVLLIQHVVQWLIENGTGVVRVARSLHLIGEAVDGRALDWLVEHVGEVVGLAPTVAYDLIGNALGNLAPDDARRRCSKTIWPWSPCTSAGSRCPNVPPAPSSPPARTRTGAGRPSGTSATCCTARAASRRAGPGLRGLRAVPPGSPWHARLTALRALGCSHTPPCRRGRGRGRLALAEGESLDDPMATGYALHAAAGVLGMRGQPAENLRLLDRGLAVVAADPRLTDLKLQMLSSRAAGLANVDRDVEAAAEFGGRGRWPNRSPRPAWPTSRTSWSPWPSNWASWDEVASEAEAVLDLGFLETNRQPAVDVLGLAAVVAVHRDEPEACARILRLLRAEDPAVAEHEVRSSTSSWPGR
jgi:hypothetical protein